MHGELGKVLGLGLTVYVGKRLNFLWENPLPGEAARISTNSLLLEYSSTYDGYGA